MIRVDLHMVDVEGGPILNRISLRLPAVPRAGETIEFGDTSFTVESVMWVSDDDAHVGDGAIDSHLAVYYAALVVR